MMAVTPAFWRKTLLSNCDVAVFFFIGLSFILFSDLATVLIDGTHVLSKGDQIWWYGAFHYFISNLANGVFPLWNPYSHGGEPFYFLISMYRLGDPLILLPLVAEILFQPDLLHSYNIYYFTKYCVFLGGCYALVRNIISALIPRLLIISILVADVHHAVFFDSMLYIDSLLWLPWAILFLSKAGTVRQPMSLYIGIYFLGLQIGVATYHGIPTAIFAASFALLYVVFHWRQSISLLQQYRYHIVWASALLMVLCMPLLMLYVDQDSILGVSRIHGYREKLGNLLVNPAEVLPFREIVLHPTHGGVHIFNPLRYYFGSTLLFGGPVVLYFFLHGVLFSAFRHRVLLAICFVLLTLLGMSVETPFYEFAMTILPPLKTIRHATVFGSINFVLIIIFVSFSLKTIFDSSSNTLRSRLPGMILSCGILSLLLYFFPFNCCGISSTPMFQYFSGMAVTLLLIIWLLSIPSIRKLFIRLPVVNAVLGLRYINWHGVRITPRHIAVWLGPVTRYTILVAITVGILLQGIDRFTGLFLSHGFSTITPRAKITRCSACEKPIDFYRSPLRAQDYAWPGPRILCLPRPDYLKFEAMIRGQATAVDSVLEAAIGTKDAAIPAHVRRWCGLGAGNRVIYWPKRYSQPYLMGERDLGSFKDWLTINRDPTRFYPKEQAFFVLPGELQRLLWNHHKGTHYAAYVRNNPDLIRAHERPRNRDQSIGEWGKWHWEVHGHKEDRPVTPQSGVLTDSPTSSPNDNRLTDRYIFLTRRSESRDSEERKPKNPSYAYGTSISDSQWSKYFPKNLFLEFDQTLTDLLNRGRYKEALITVLRYGFTPADLIYQTPYLDQHRNKSRIVTLTHLFNNQLVEANVAQNTPKIVSSNVNELTIEFKVKRDGYLLLSDTHDDQWTVSINDRVAPLLLANEIYKAVFVSTRDTKAEFRYNLAIYPFAILFGIMLPVFALIIIMIQRMLLTTPKSVPCD